MGSLMELLTQQLGGDGLNQISADENTTRTAVSTALPLLINALSRFEANKPMLKDPNKIYPGQTLRIPPLT